RNSERVNILPSSSPSELSLSFSLPDSSELLSEFSFSGPLLPSLSDPFPPSSEKNCKFSLIGSCNSDFILRFLHTFKLYNFYSSVVFLRQQPTKMAIKKAIH